MEPVQQNEEEDSVNGVSANAGYAAAQLARAFAASQEHPDPAARLRAAQKIEKWVKVVGGMLSGALNVGSRAPLANTPVWATLQVVHGGFATGDLLAGGALQPRELSLLDRLALSRSDSPRAALNNYYLSAAGFVELQQMFSTGCYRVNVPEEGALLVVTWLLEQEQEAAAQSLLKQIAPFFDRLRFYPVPDVQPLTDSLLVRLQSVGETIQSLQAIRVPERFAAQREAELVWAPLCDRAVALFLETCTGPAPSVQVGPNGRPVRGVAGQFSIGGGWPCQQYPSDWQARARTLLNDYGRLRKQHTLCGKPEKPGENFTLLRQYLAVCIQNPARLTGRDVGCIRSILAHIITQRGLPDSEHCQSLRRAQALLAARPDRAQRAQVVMDRLAGLPRDGGVNTLDDVLAPVTAVEAPKYQMAVGQQVAARLENKVRRCLLASPEVLVEQGVIPSGEVLAKVIPQISAQAVTAGLPAPDIKRLYGALYQAFRRRRSLLLLNLESQVKFAELPWVQAVEAQRSGSPRTQAMARQTLEQVVTLAVTAFPHQILPNKLLQELRTLAQNAELSIPFVDEVAADIFMGAFSEKFLRAARIAGHLLEGSLYERYYGLSYARVQQIAHVEASAQGGTPTSPAFFALCSELAGTQADSGGSFVARNGMILEQEQILTTHNLAALYTTLDLADTLQPRLEELAQRCFAWTCRRLQQLTPNLPWQTRLQTVKNMAYAWRQMVFFLALQPKDMQDAFLVWAYDHLAKQPADVGTRFHPAVKGLEQATQALSLKGLTQDTTPQQSRRFLGWTTQTHWLLQDTPPRVKE